MHYQISRNGQTYGPYTLEDLQRYVASGNILPTDMAKNEEMTDWVPVSQLLAPPAAAAAAPPLSPGFSSPGYADTAYANPTASPAYDQANPLASSPYQDSPNLNWGLLLLLNFVLYGTLQRVGNLVITFCFKGSPLTTSLDFYYVGAAAVVWNLIIASWLKRVQPNATSVYYYLGAAALTLVQIAVAVQHGLHWGFSSHFLSNYDPIGGIIGLCVWVVRLIARFSQRASLQEHFNTVEPVGLQLNPVMTFFFGGIYFQYHLNRINQMKQAARFGAGRGF